MDLGGVGMDFAISENVCHAGPSGPHSVPKSNLIAITSAQTLEVMQVVWPHLALGQSVCVKCRNQARSENRRRSSSRSPSPSRRRETFDLSLSSPILQEEAARRIVEQDRPALDPNALTEVTDGPLAGLSVPDAFQTLANSAPQLVDKLQKSSGDSARAILSEIGTLLAKQARNQELALVVARVDTTAQWSALCVSELETLYKFMPSIDEALGMNAWDMLAEVFVSEKCAHLRAFVEKAVTLPGDHRNVGRQSRAEKLKKAFHVLIQLGKIRSERCNGLALKMSVYFRSLGVPTSAINSLVQFGMTVSNRTCDTYMDAWIEKNYHKQLAQIMKKDVQLVIDNVNLYLPVSEFTGKKESRMLNMVSGYLMHVPEPSADLSKQLPPKCKMTWETLLPTDIVIKECTTIFGRVFQNVLVDLADTDVTEEDPWQHKGPLGPAEMVSLEALDEDPAKTSNMWTILREYRRILFLDPDRVWKVLGDHGTIKAVDKVSGLFAKDKVEPLNVETLPGLFHMEMAVPHNLLWKLFQPEMKDAARRLGVKKALGEPRSMHNTFSRVIAFALASHTGAAWDAFRPTGKKTIASFTRDVMDGFSLEKNEKRAHFRRFLTLLAAAQAWKECCRHADGEGIFSLIQYLTPYLSVIHSTNYFPLLARFICQIRSSSSYQREKTLQSLFINVRGISGGAKACDLQMEYLVCALKRYLKNIPAPDADLLTRTSRLLPLFEMVRKDVDTEFHPARVSTKHTIGSNKEGVERWRDLMRLDYGNSVQHISDENLKKKKAYPIFSLIDSLVKKTEHLVNGHWKVNYDALLPMELDQHEEEFLCE